LGKGVGSAGILPATICRQDGGAPTAPCPTKCWCWARRIVP